ncbi:MAG: amidohydrolase family protein [Gammaproteobacteria bacterium]|nr:amidohydrolase family protein [Gammaproteobacteria bacterium]
MQTSTQIKLLLFLLTLCTFNRVVDAQTIPFEITDGSPVVFTSVSVIPMDSERVIPDQDVVIVSGLITEIAPTGMVTIPANAEIIDASGLFLMPGLVDMHTHLGAEVAITGGTGINQMQVYLAGGVTTILNQGDFIAPFGNGLISLGQRIRNGELAGPTLYTASYARGPSDGGAPQQIVETELDGRDHVIGSKAAGYNYIKIYNATPLQAYEGIIDQARIENMAIMGHFPSPVGSAKALADGMAMVSHAEAYFYSHYHFAQDPTLTLSAINQTLNSRASVNTTLYILETIAAIWGGNTAAFNAFLAKPQMQYVHPAEIQVWRNGFEGSRWSPPGSQPGALDSRFAFVKQYTKDFHYAGIRLIAGTDSPTVLGAPGFSTHEEMRVLAQLGLSRFEILTITTRNAADFIAETIPAALPFGTIEVGKRADILLLNANPLVDLRNAQNAVGVMARGNWYSRANLDSRLEAIAAQYAAMTPVPQPPSSGGGGGSAGLALFFLLCLGLRCRYAGSTGQRS